MLHHVLKHCVTQQSGLETQSMLATSQHSARQSVLTTCHDHGILPVVTFHHFTSPRWLIALGGWEDKRTVDRFARYCERATRHFGDLIGTACTLNEPNLSALLAARKLMPPTSLQRFSPMWVAAARQLRIARTRLAPFPFTNSSRAFDVKLAAHRQAVKAIKSGPGNFPVGMTLALMDIQATEGAEKVASRMRREINDVYLEALRGDDFVGVQTYSRIRVGRSGIVWPEKDVELNQMGEEFYPEALEATIHYAAAVAGIPVLVTENGIATNDDTRRVAYIQRALRGVANCLRAGVDVRGYIYWTALDNFEWIFGYQRAFGLIAVDRKSQERSIKPSADWLGALARANGLPRNEGA